MIGLLNSCFIQYHTSFPLWITFFVLIHSFDATSSNLDEVLLINQYANVFVFGDFHHKDWITYSGGTDGAGEH